MTEYYEAERVGLPPGGPGGHVKYLDEMLRERCIVCLERWPCTEVIHER